MPIPKFFRKRPFLWIGAAFLLAFFIPIASKYTMTSGQLWDLPLVGKTIVIDPGHGGKDGGAVSKEGVVEKDITLPISLFLKDQLEQAGAYVVLTRDEDEELSDPEAHKLGKRKAQDLSRRVKLIEEVKADMVISIHLNAIPSSKYRGAQTFYNPLKEENKRLAEAIQKELIDNIEHSRKETKAKNDVYLLKNSPAPTALVEAGFLSNPEESALLAQESYQKKVSSAIYFGILSYYTGSNEQKK